jgi:hypothetical protein
MTKTSRRILTAMSLVIASSAAPAQTTGSPAEPVTVENYSRAQKLRKVARRSFSMAMAFD